MRKAYNIDTEKKNTDSEEQIVKRDYRRPEIIKLGAVKKCTLGSAIGIDDSGNETGPQISPGNVF